MDLKLFGFSISLEILILIAIIYLIIVVTTLSSCCNVSDIAEGFASQGLTGGMDKVVKDVAKQLKKGIDKTNM